MSTVNKKSKTLSATSISKLVNKHAKRAHSADKASSSSRCTHQSNPELITVSDQQSVQSDHTVTAEGYNGVLQRPVTPSFDNRNEYTTKTKTDKKRKMHQDCFTQSGFPPLPVGSDCGSLYPTPGRNQVSHNTVSDNVNEFNSTIEQENKELRALLSRSRMALVKLTHEVEQRNMADARYKNYRKNDSLSAFENLDTKKEPVENEQKTGFMPVLESSNTRDDRCLEQPRPYTHREPVYSKGFVYRETIADNLDRKFHRFTKITKPRQTLNYFEGEFERLNVTDEKTKYNIIVGKWVPDEVAQYYGLVSPEDRNFQSFKEFIERRDHFLPPILGKAPIHTSSTSFSAYLAEATEWATAHEDDRIKFFLYHHAPSSLKSRIEEYFVEDLIQFKRRVQAIWSHQNDDHPVPNAPVNYDRSRKNQDQRHNRRRNNGQDDFSNQNYRNSGNHVQGFDNRNQNYGNGGNYAQSFNNRNKNYGNGINYGRNFNDRNQNYNNASNFGHNSNGRDQNHNFNPGIYERNFNNSGQNFNNSYNNCRNVTYSNELSSRPNNVNNYSRQGNSVPPSQ